MRVDLLDPDLFAANAFWPTLRHLRQQAPVHWHDHPDGGGFWVVTRYDDIVAVYTDHDSFSSRYGMRLDSNPEAVSAVAQRMLIVSDAPDHTRLKRVLAGAFAPNEMPRFEALVRQVVRETVTEALDRVEFDFIDIAKQVPNRVVCAFMGVPRADWEWLGDIATEAFEGADEQARSGAHSEIFLYFGELLGERRRSPGEDFLSRIAADGALSEETGERRPLTDEEIVFNCNGVLAGANETTRYSAAGGVLAFMENPGQWNLLRSASGPEAIPAAVEEILRWTVPGVHAMRTALRPARVGGVDIAPGDRVTVWNASANRDESVFADPDAFLVRRTPNRHITFGAGRHLCLGARLARLELGVLFEELTSRVKEFRPTGQALFNASNFTWGVRSLPVAVTPA
ncbi:MULTISPECIES: cytochrome P450 [Streptomyces]|uniref:cytochrome P450 n=1 Tax=Streptomyces TaxID=1883 RepID=UPI0016713A61|nr:MULTISPECIES: cytochrome P450 [Streptomyces]UFR06595.1 cytochrome P450 [Streptomyces sp. Go40/10]GGS53594.1 putative cytochrome P450 126 [Streptomyces cinerochromogenes]